jgi:hypothetical protein
MHDRCLPGLRKSVYTESLAIQFKRPLIRFHEGGGGSVAGAKGTSNRGKGNSASTAGTRKESSGEASQKGGAPGPAVFGQNRFATVQHVLSKVPMIYLYSPLLILCFPRCL